MSNTEYNRPSEHLRPAEIVIVSFGFSRNRSDNPWFKRKDYLEALSTSPDKDMSIEPSNYSTYLTDLEKRSIVETTYVKVRGARGVPQRIAHVTDDGEEVLLENVLYSVTHRGLTVPQLIPIPEAASAVLSQSDLVDRVIRAISGTQMQANQRIEWL